MEKIGTELPGVYIIVPQVYSDHRGFFMETYSAVTFAGLGLDHAFVQDNQSFTKKKGTLRGIHFQNDPMAQCKIVRVPRGAITDVVVDLRRGSPTYRKWVAVELTQDNKRMLFIPRGFGHGFLTLTDNVECCYKVDNIFSRELDRGIRFDDPEIGIQWNVVNPILSEKDINSPLLRNSDCNYTYKKEND